MNPKIERVCKDIDKTKGKIGELQARLRELERKPNWKTPRLWKRCGAWIFPLPIWPPCSGQLIPLTRRQPKNEKAQTTGGAVRRFFHGR